MNFAQSKKIGITLKIILINVILFILFFILLATKTISHDFIALRPSNILSGKYLWTFISSMFMHANAFHLLANMISLFFVGMLVEKIIGRKRFIWFYLLSGLIAGIFFILFSLIFKDDFNSYAVGASGALFGLIGLLMIITPNLPVYIMFIPIPIKMKYAAIGILVILWAISLTTGINIGNTAHLGGLVAGLVYGIYLKNKYKNKIRAIRRYFS